MARKRRKLHDGKKQVQKRRDMTPDLISELPDHVIHHILSFLPIVDVIRMSLLSRHWRRMWYSVPALNFSDYDIKEGFNNFLQQCLKHRKMGMQQNSNSVITKFKLDMHYHGDSFQVDSWLRFAAQAHLEELDLCMKHDDCSCFQYCTCSRSYCLPLVALNLTSLTSLNLECMKLEDCSPINLPSLKSLSLGKILVKDEVLHNLVLGCPSLQKLFIEECYPLAKLRLSTSSLKFLHIDGEWREIQVEAINLESFVYCGSCCCSFDLACCKKLSSLSMTGGYFYRDEYFENLISGFPLLESLTLDECNLVDIRHQYLKVLVLVKYLDEEDEKYEDEDEEEYEISIDAPNLVSFSYKGAGSLIKISMNSPNLLETNIYLGSHIFTKGREWYVDILDFLSCLDCSQSMSFILHSEEALIFPRKLRKLRRSPLPDLKHLKVKTYCELKRESDLKEALFWLSPSLQTLSINGGEIKSLTNL